MFRCSAINAQEQIASWPLNLSVGRGGFYGSVQYYFGYNQLRRSILKDPEEETKFRRLVAKAGGGRPIKCAVEIGTYKGTATALLAYYADQVVTIDKYNFIDKYTFWLEYGVYDKIHSYIVKDNEDKADVLAKYNFDLAFLDGDHSAEGVRADFNLVKKCGKVIFHDYYEENTGFDKGSAIIQGVVSLVNSLPLDEVTIGRPFAYWEKKR